MSHSDDTMASMKKLMATAAIALLALTGCATSDQASETATVEAVATDEQRTAQFEQELKTMLGVNESFSELLVSDPTLWGGYINGVRIQSANAYITLQADKNTLDGKDLGQRATKSLTTLFTQDQVDSLGIDWIIVEDSTGTVIDQTQPDPLI